MRQNNITCFLAIAFSFLAIVSCNEVLDGEISSTDNAAPLAARSVAGTADYYYWYNGEKNKYFFNERSILYILA